MIQVSAPEMILPANNDIILTWPTTVTDVEKQHTKKEYVKILHGASYKVAYHIQWKNTQPTTQPLQITIYKVTPDFEIITLHRHVTVCVSQMVNLKKDFTFELKAKERICIGAKNFSTVDFILINSQFSVTKV